MRPYTEEDLETDLDWLEDSRDRKEYEQFIISLIKKGFAMTRTEFLEFMEATTWA